MPSIPQIIRYKPTILALITGFSLLVIGSTQAQEAQNGPWSFRIEGGAAHQSDSDLKDGGGKFSLDRWFVSAGIDYAWNQRNSAGISVGGGRSDYVFDEQTAFGGGNPWGEIEDLRLAVTTRFKISNTGTGILIPTVRTNSESGADSGDSRTYGLFAAVAWRVNEGLTIGPGIGMFSRLEDGTRIFPILVIDWDIGERWNLSTGRGLAASQGPGLTLSYKVSKRWKIGLTGRYEDLEFRLDDEGAAPGGIGRDQSFPLVLSGVFDAGPMASFSVFAGAELSGKLKLNNAFDELVDESSYDPAAIFGATVELRF
jgi:hypothetical protein